MTQVVVNTDALESAQAGALYWKPNAGPQERALRIPDNVREILYGGARGGGKTDAGIAWLIKPVRRMNNKPTIQHPRYRALVLRRGAKDLNDWLDRADWVYKGFGGRLIKHPQTYFVFPSGAKIYVGHLKDVSAYQGHEYQRILIEELTQIAHEDTYTKLLGSLRSTVPEIKPQIFNTSNPGNKGHGWVRRRFVTAAPWDTFFLNPSTNAYAIFIPSKVTDNPKLIEADPDYVKWLDGIRHTDEKLYRMWREGEWDAFSGQIFGEWNYERHTFNEFWFDLRTCERIAALDWGYRDPTSIHWIARMPENQYGVQHIFIYREAYKSEVIPKVWGNVLGQISNPTTGIDPIKYIVLPHDTYSRRPETGNTIAEIIGRESGVRTKSAENMTKDYSLNRIALMHQLLSPSPDGMPYLQVHRSCSNLIRTLPELVYDETIIEQIDSDADDHSFHSSTYGLMTLKPKFAQAGSLVQMQHQALTPANLGWPQNNQGQYVPPDILAAVARPQMVRRGDAEA